MSDEAVKSILDQFSKPMAEASSIPAVAPTLDQLVAEHMAMEDEEKPEKVNPFDLINKGSVEIRSIEEANAVLKLLLEAEATAERTKAAAALKVKRTAGRAQRLNDIFAGALRTWTVEQVRGKKRRSIVLDEGQVGLRKVASRITTFCEPDLTAWAEREYVEAVAYVPKVSIEIVKNWEEKNGKPAPGRIRVDESESFNYKPVKGGQESE